MLTMVSMRMGVSDVIACCMLVLSEFIEDMFGVLIPSWEIVDMSVCQSCWLYIGVLMMT